MNIISFTTVHPEEIYKTTSLTLVPKGATVISNKEASEEYSVSKLKKMFSEVFLKEVGVTHKEAYDEFVHVKRSELEAIQSSPTAESKGNQMRIQALEEDLANAHKECIKNMTHDPATDRYLDKFEVTKLARERHFVITTHKTMGSEKRDTSFEAVELFLEMINKDPSGDYSIQGVYSPKGGATKVKVLFTYHSVMVKMAA